MAKKVRVKWLSRPEDHDYPAALSYLSLIYDPTTVAGMVRRLKKAAMVEFKAKDIFRASALPLLGTVNSHVKRNQQKIMDGEKMTPLLLIRDPANGRLIIADGYHRMCAVYSFDEDAVIPCQIA
jgi:disulfide oxidoreductase YuzD